jgi:hypothetical protein
MLGEHFGNSLESYENLMELCEINLGTWLELQISKNPKLFKSTLEFSPKIS